MANASADIRNVVLKISPLILKNRQNDSNLKDGINSNGITLSKEIKCV